MVGDIFQKKGGNWTLETWIRLMMMVSGNHVWIHVARLRLGLCNIHQNGMEPIP